MSSQTSRILKHLQRQTITPLQALNRYGIMRLAPRIQELRESGYKIVTEMAKKGEKRFARYRLVA